MNVEIKLPALGENIAGGDVVSVLVREGDVIAANDGVVEVETDKAVVEIPCPQAGKITKVLVTKGQAIKVGEPILTLETEASPSGSAHAESPQAAAPAKPKAVAAEMDPGPADVRTIPAGPEARRLARELGVDLPLLHGSGRGGRITVEDVRSAAAQLQPASDEPERGQQPKTPETPAAGIPAQRGSREPAVPPGQLGEDAYGHVRREPMSRIRRTIAAQMTKSASTIPHVTNFDDADVTELERIRKTIPPAYLGPTVKLTAMPFALKAVALALRQHPLLNASLDEEKQEIVYKQYVNLGVAVDTPRGLVVPVIHNVDRLGIVELARELTLLAARARAAEFGVDELRGGTFTISNLGAVGGVYSTPIINHPEVAILLLGRSRWLLGIHEGKIEGRLKMPLSLSFDHRVVDGAAAARFLNDVIDYLQSPGKLLLVK
jgi:pyruvate dehydrogenase E2 component (dihydrolipoamide acetyltransferase)